MEFSLELVLYMLKKVLSIGAWEIVVFIADAISTCGYRHAVCRIFRGGEFELEVIGNLSLK
jgi:hypothetical protein